MHLHWKNTYVVHMKTTFHMKIYMSISLFLNDLAKNIHVCEVHLWHFVCEGGDNLIETTIFDSQTTEGTGQQALSSLSGCGN